MCLHMCQMCLTRGHFRILCTSEAEMPPWRGQLQGLTSEQPAACTRSSLCHAVVHCSAVLPLLLLVSASLEVCMCHPAHPAVANATSITHLVQPKFVQWLAPPSAPAARRQRVPRTRLSSLFRRAPLSHTEAGMRRHLQASLLLLASHQPGVGPEDSMPGWRPTKDGCIRAVRRCHALAQAFQDTAMLPPRGAYALLMCNSFCKS